MVPFIPKLKCNRIMKRIHHRLGANSNTMFEINGSQIPYVHENYVSSLPKVHPWSCKETIAMSGINGCRVGGNGFHIEAHGT